MKRPRDARPGERVDEEELLRCLTCGTPLGSDPEDDPEGEGKGRPICGECNRARNFDVFGRPGSGR